MKITEPSDPIPSVEGKDEELISWMTQNFDTLSKKQQNKILKKIGQATKEGWNSLLKETTTEDVPANIIKAIKGGDDAEPIEKEKQKTIRQVHGMYMARQLGKVAAGTIVKVNLIAALSSILGNFLIWIMDLIGII